MPSEWKRWSSACLAGVLACSWIVGAAGAQDETPTTSEEPAEEARPGGPHVIAQPGNPFIDGPCASEWERMCSHTTGWRLGFECLRGNRKAGSLLSDCANWTDETVVKKRERSAARMRAWADACEGDIQKFCSEYDKTTAQKGCLRRVRDQISPKCDELLPNRPAYNGPGYAGWKDGSEPEDFDDELARRLRPRQAQAAEDAKEREAKRDEVRERMARSKEQAEAQAADAESGVDATTADE